MAAHPSGICTRKGRIGQPWGFSPLLDGGEEVLKIANEHPVLNLSNPAPCFHGENLEYARQFLILKIETRNLTPQSPNTKPWVQDVASEYAKYVERRHLSTQVSPLNAPTPIHLNAKLGR